MLKKQSRIVRDGKFDGPRLHQGLSPQTINALIFRRVSMSV